MTADEFRAFRQTYFASQAQCAFALGLHQRTQANYERGVHKIPRYVELACAAYGAGLSSWTPPAIAAE